MNFWLGGEATKVGECFIGCGGIDAPATDDESLAVKSSSSEVCHPLVGAVLFRDTSTSGDNFRCSRVYPVCAINCVA